MSLFKWVILLAGIGSFFLVACEESDTTPPTVSISSHTSGQVISEITRITAMTQDNKGIRGVEFFIEGNLVYTDYDSPYQYDWNTSTYEDGSYTVKVISYDNSENHTESQPIMLILDNTESYPIPVDILSIIYSSSEMTIQWSRNVNSDFNYYSILISETVDGEKISLVEHFNRSDTSFVTTDFDPSSPHWYWVGVTDSLGFSSIGSGYYLLDDSPTLVDLFPVIYEDNSFLLNWSQNQDDDFRYYRVYQSEVESMNNRVELYSTTNRMDTSFVVNEIEGEIYRFYQVSVEDAYGLQSLGNVEVGSSFSVFVKVFGGEVNDVGSFVRQTTDNGYILIGSTNSYGAGNDDILLIKTDRHGEVEWEKTYGGSNYDRGVCIQQTEDGGYILLGNTNSYGSGNGDIWLLKTNSSGDLLWTQTCCSEINWEQSYGGNYVEQTSDGGFITTGFVWNSRMDILVIKTDLNGDTEWVKEYGELWKDDKGYSIHQTIDDQYFLTGYTESYGNGETDVYLMKLSSTGDSVWEKTFGGDDHDRGFSSALTSDGGVIITGYTYSFGMGNYDLWLLKSDSDGNEEWNQTFGWGDGEEGLSVEQTNDGGYIVTGNAYYSGGNDIQLWLIKTDQSGNTSWEKEFGGDDRESGQSVQQSQDGGYVVVGSSQSYEGSNYNNIVLIKTDSQGNTELSGE